MEVTPLICEFSIIGPRTPIIAIATDGDEDTAFVVLNARFGTKLSKIHVHPANLGSGTPVECLRCLARNEQT
jgi:hypothetical protein